MKYNDPKGLAETIVKVMDDKELLRTWGKNAKKAVREKFNLDKVVQETYNLYEESLGK